ncbi:hypothetical protein NBRC116586_36400 [Pseudooceanicola nitratireducens]
MGLETKLDLTVKHLRVLNRPIGRIDIVKREINTTLFVTCK